VRARENARETWTLRGREEEGEGEIKQHRQNGTVDARKRRGRDARTPTGIAAPSYETLGAPSTLDCVQRNARTGIEV